MPGKVTDSRAVRMVDVAARAGVSQTTASRVLSGFKNVAPDTRAAVTEAAEALGYEVNLAARSLASARSQSIGFVVSEPSAHLWNGTYFPRLLKGITEAAEDSHLQLAIFMRQPEQTSKRLRRYLTQGHVDGLLVITSTRDDPLLVDLLSHGMAVVVGGRPIGVDDASYVDVDNFRGAAVATNHLLKNGYKRPAHIAGPSDTAAGEDRLRGYLHAMQQSDIPPTFVQAKDFSYQEGAAAAISILEHEPTVDAFFAAGDSLGLGAMTAVTASGRRIPEDVGLIGFDDSEPAAAATPPMSSMFQSVEQLGKEMVRLLISRIADGDQPPLQSTLGTRLVGRQSTRGPALAPDARD